MLFLKTCEGKVLWESLFNSLSISTMQEAGDKSGLLLGIFQMAHIITILTLIVLSIASYVGNKDKLTKRERDLYRYVYEEEKK